VNASELLVEWAAKYGVESVLERMSGDARSLCSSIASAGARMSVLVDNEDLAHAVRGGYDACDARLASRPGELEKHDLVVLHGGGIREAEIVALAKLAVKLVVVIAPNPGALAARFRGKAAWGATASLAPVLWSFGRVREHVFVDFPPFAAGIPRLLRVLARSHVFAVDVTPRSPQARRKLRLSAQ
jgi:hypothetical protein